MLCRNGLDRFGYRDVLLLRQFLTPSGLLIGRRHTGSVNIHVCSVQFIMCVHVHVYTLHKLSCGCTCTCIYMHIDDKDNMIVCII